MIMVWTSDGRGGMHVAPELTYDEVKVAVEDEERDEPRS